MKKNTLVYQKSQSNSWGDKYYFSSGNKLPSIQKPPNLYLTIDGISNNRGNSKDSRKSNSSSRSRSRSREKKTSTSPISLSGKRIEESPKSLQLKGSGIKRIARIVHLPNLYRKSLTKDGRTTRNKGPSRRNDIGLRSTKKIINRFSSFSVNHISSEVRPSEEHIITRMTPLLTIAKFSLSSCFFREFDRHGDQAYEIFARVFSFLEEKDLRERIPFVCKIFYAMSCHDFIWRSFAFSEKNKIFVITNRTEYYLYWKRMYYQLPPKIDLELDLTKNKGKVYGLIQESRRSNVQLPSLLQHKEGGSSTNYSSSIDSIHSSIPSNFSSNVSESSSRSSLASSSSVVLEDHFQHHRKTTPTSPTKISTLTKNREKVKRLSAKGIIFEKARWEIEEEQQKKKRKKKKQRVTTGTNPSNKTTAITKESKKGTKNISMFEQGIHCKMTDLQKQKVLKLFDDDQDGIVSFNDFRKASKDFGWKIPEREITKMLLTFKSYSNNGGLILGDIPLLYVWIHEWVQNNLDNGKLVRIPKRVLRYHVKYPF